MILVGYLLIMMGAAPTGLGPIMMLTAFFLGIQLPAVFLSSKIGSRDSLAVSTAIAAVGAYLRSVNPYLSAAVTGAAMGMYFTSMVSVVGLALGIMGKTRHVITSYVLLLSTGLLIASLSLGVRNGYDYAVAGGLLAAGLLLSLSPNILKVHSIHLRQAIHNKDLLLLSVAMAVSWSYLMQLMPRLHGIDSVLMLPMIPTAVLTRYLIRLAGVRRIIAASLIGLSASGVLAEANMGVAALMGVFAVMAYMSVLVMLSTLVSPMLFTTSLAYIYELSIVLSILVEYALSSFIGTIAAALICFAAAAIILKVREPAKIFEEKVI